MARLRLVLILLSSTLTLRAQSAPDEEWTTEVMPADGGDNGDKGDTDSKAEPFISVKLALPPSEAGDEEDNPTAKTAVKPTATIAAPKKGKPKGKAIKTAKSKPKGKATAPTAPPEPAFARESGSVRGGFRKDVAAEPKAPPVPAVPLTPIAPRNP